MHLFSPKHPNPAFLRWTFIAVSCRGAAFGDAHPCARCSYHPWSQRPSISPPSCHNNELSANCLVQNSFPRNLLFCHHQPSTRGGICLLPFARSVSEHEREQTDDRTPSPPLFHDKINEANPRTGPRAPCLLIFNWGRS